MTATDLPMHIPVPHLILTDIILNSHFYENLKNHYETRLPLPTKKTRSSNELKPTQRKEFIGTTSPKRTLLHEPKRRITPLIETHKNRSYRRGEETQRKRGEIGCRLSVSLCSNPNAVDWLVGRLENGARRGLRPIKPDNCCNNWRSTSTEASLRWFSHSCQAVANSNWRKQRRGRAENCAALL
jgi:hypothetical protein